MTDRRHFNLWDISMVSTFFSASEHCMLVLKWASWSEQLCKIVGSLPKHEKENHRRKKSTGFAFCYKNFSNIFKKLSYLILPMHLGLVRRVTDVCLFMRITDLSSGKSKLWERGNIIFMKNCPQYANALQKQQLVSAAFAHYYCSFLETWANVLTLSILCHRRIIREGESHMKFLQLS